MAGNSSASRTIRRWNALPIELMTEDIRAATSGADVVFHDLRRHNPDEYDDQNCSDDGRRKWARSATLLTTDKTRRITPRPDHSAHADRSQLPSPAVSSVIARFGNSTAACAPV